MRLLYPRWSATLQTPFGVSLLVRSDGHAVVESAFVRAKPSASRITDPVLREAAAQARAYFRKRLRRFDLPLQLNGTPLQISVWEYVAGLETGEIISYGDLARAIGKPRTARGVASAMSRTPLALFIPAHRVVGADGTVRGSSAGSMRRRLLAFEGNRLA